MSENRISLRDCYLHSKQVESIVIADFFTLNIRPWTARQWDEIKPLVLRLLKEFKSMPKDSDAFEMAIRFLEKDEYKKDILHLIYVTIERGNETITVNGSQIKQVLFSESEMEDFEASDLIEIMQVIWKQNFEKNLLRGSNQNQTEATIQKMEAVASPVISQ